MALRPFVITCGVCFILIILAMHEPTIAKLSTILITIPPYRIASSTPDNLPRASYVRPLELLSREFPPEQPTNGSIPKFIHQSWPTRELLPMRSSDSWRKLHPDWVWVLWTDKDNQALVDRCFPWFDKTYQRLQGPIQRAAVAKYLYMYAFGGYETTFRFIITD
jgi:mannosyltransferase OCH1-like enzyme